MKKKLIKIGLLIVLPLVVLLLLGMFIFKTGGILSYLSGVLYIATAINQHIGLNIWLARIIALPFLVAGYYYGIRFVLFVPEKRNIGYLSLLVVWVVICVSMFATQGSFSRVTGEALKYYFTDDQGQIVLRDHGGVDSETGVQLQKVTPEIIKQYRLQQEGVLKVTDDTLFDPNTGKPLKRYYKAQDGTISLFPADVRFHPQYGTQLELITPEIAEQLSQQPSSPASPESDVSEDGQETATPETGGRVKSSPPVNPVPDESTDQGMSSQEDIDKLNQEYKNRVQGQLESIYSENENHSQENFEKALDKSEQQREEEQN